MFSAILAQIPPLEGHLGPVHQPARGQQGGALFRALDEDAVGEGVDDADQLVLDPGVGLGAVQFRLWGVMV